jgi:hypothetical protein
VLDLSRIADHGIYRIDELPLWRYATSSAELPSPSDRQSGFTGRSHSLTINTMYVTDADPTPDEGAATSDTSPDAATTIGSSGGGDYLIHDVIGGTAAMIDGLAGNDLIVGGDEDQTINRGAGDDILGGGGGTDVMIGGAGDDLMFGGAGADEFQIANGDGDDVIADFILADGDSITALAADVFSTVDQTYGVLVTFDLGNTVQIHGSDFDASDISSMYI